jgi:hypothetical protein
MVSYWAKKREQGVRKERISMERGMVLLSFIGCILIGLYSVSFATAEPVDKDTVALWLFDEGSGGVAKDSSGNGNDAKLVAAEWDKGMFGSAVKFDGIAGKVDYVEVPGSASLDIIDALTIEVWVNITKHQNDHVRIVTGYNAGMNAGYSLLLTDAGQMKNMVHVGGGWKINTGRTVIPEGEWTHLALVFDGQTIKLYMNGDMELEGPAGGKITSRGMDAFFIGRLNAGDPETPDGMIDELRISNVARSQEEIKETMEGLAGAPVELLGKLTTAWGSLKQY